MKNFVLASVLVIAFATAVAAQSSRQVEGQPAVTKAVAPVKYPPIALAAGAEGKVVVEVKIDAAGNVTSADGIEGHKILQAVVLPAAKRWQFASTADGSVKRTARLSFVFRLLPVKGGNEEESVSFVPPYQVEIAKRKPEVVNVINQ